MGLRLYLALLLRFHIFISIFANFSLYYFFAYSYPFMAFVFSEPIFQEGLLPSQGS